MHKAVDAWVIYGNRWVIYGKSWVIYAFSWVIYGVMGYLRNRHEAFLFERIAIQNAEASDVLHAYGPSASQIAHDSYHLWRWCLILPFSQTPYR